jgi:dTMP kinase
MNNKIIAFEGLDGSGKSTLISKLSKSNLNTHILKAPGLSNYSETIYKHFDNNQITIETKLLCFLDMFKGLNELDIKDHKIILLDRYYWSSLAYLEDSYNTNTFQYKCFKYLCETYLPKPDLVIYLDVDIETTLARIIERGTEKSPFETKDRLLKIQSRYQYIIQDSTLNVHKISSCQNYQTILDQTLRLLYSL